MNNSTKAYLGLSVAFDSGNIIYVLLAEKYRVESYLVSSKVTTQTVKARVFVSCGQRGKEEKRIAFLIEQGLENLGFEPYVAIHKQSTRSLMKNILHALKQCEYYLFIDFHREQLDPNGKGDLSDLRHRGSLFTNQELAIAAYLEKPLIAFQENNVKTRQTYPRGLWLFQSSG